MVGLETLRGLKSPLAVDVGVARGIALVLVLGNLEPVPVGVIVLKLLFRLWPMTEEAGELRGVSRALLVIERPVDNMVEMESRSSWSG